MSRQRALPMIVIACGVLGGCVVGPNFKPPAGPVFERYLPAADKPTPTLAQVAGEPVQRFVPAESIDPHWTRMFGSPVLDALEAEALRRNADIAAAEATLRQGRELYRAQRASTFPLVEFAGSATRAKNSDAIASPLANNDQNYSLYDAQLNLTYVMDVFGGERRQNENAAAQAEQQRYQAAATYLTVTVNVATTVLQIAGAGDQLRAQEAILAANRRALALTRTLAARGEMSTADVASAESAVETAVQPTRALQKQVATLADLLAVYVGREPAEQALPKLSLSDFTVPADLPVTLPSSLVRQRPDIRAAEANLHAASANVGVALAARLPTFTLTGSAGGTSPAVQSVLSGPNTLWSIVGNAGATVFDAGALRHKQRAAEAALDQAKAQYRGVVLTAVQGVGDALQSLSVDTLALGDAVRSREIAARSLRIVTAEAQQGQVGALPQINAEIAVRQGDAALAQARAARQTDTVALFQALGGGWSETPTHVDRTLVRAGG